MPYPLTFKTGGILQTMSLLERQNLYSQILENFATNDGPGNIYTSNPGSGTLIGSFVDNYNVGAIGSSDITYNQAVYDLFQDLTQPSGTNPPSPLWWDPLTLSVQAMTAGDLNAFADQVLISREKTMQI